MNHITTSKPEDFIDSLDRGDDVQHRFRFQNTYTAILCCGLTNSLDIAELYCEHHEDILVKFNDNQYEGVQVKTRELKLKPFVFSDDEIQNSITRFVQLHLKFQGLFRSFRIVTNHGFAQTLNNNIREIITLAKNGKADVLLKNRTKSKKCINTISKNCKCSNEEVISVIAKIDVRDGTSNLSEVKMNLVFELQGIHLLQEQTIGKLKEIASELINFIYTASTKGDNTFQEAYLLGKNFDEEDRKRLIENKRITKEKILALIKKSVENPLRHFLTDEASLHNKTLGVSVLEQKLEAGKISSSNLSLMQDYKYSLESLTAMEMHKLGEERLKGKYNQLQMIVNSEAQEIFDECFKEGEPFGKTMLSNVRKKLRDRWEKYPDSFNNYDYEHLLGMLAVLTEDCKIWWSKPFNISK